ncbi:ribonuclease 3 [Quercus suber]|uniref:Ribonuclease 3 n=1 Tax=Quercus suber TaxID=58331 RepID=A0AAW0KHN4_QUESU|nr:ribonuclease 3 [Quercus suber]
MSELQHEWPNLNGDDKQFWSHKWEAHGMCFEKLLDAFSYFKTTLELKNSVDLLRYLAEANITPSKVKAYTGNDISAAITSKTRFEPRLWCRASMLMEINICVDNLA